MSKARALANLMSAGNPLADGIVNVSDINGLTTTVDELNILSGIAVTKAELNNVAGVNTSVQAQLGTKASATDLNNAIASLGTAASLNVGVGANQVVQLDAQGKLPAVDGGQLTNIQGYSIASALAFE
jgi:hypothetical protein